ncbi:hypothetical protein, partial [Bifidobacterium dentium]|uniref:hypothetical protein n=1 Tax=Bifidobacterium dentium TaxID=1689 RepID=UPI0034A567CA
SRKQDPSSCGNGDGHISALVTLIIIFNLRGKLIEIKRHLIGLSIVSLLFKSSHRPKASKSNLL